MRKLILFNMVTIDGYFDALDKELDWHGVDEEFSQFSIEQLNSVDILLFGRITYQLMESYWTTQMAKENDPEIAEKMNSYKKIVVSNTLDKVQWNNSFLIQSNIKETITGLKGETGKDIIIFGSADLTTSLIEMKLIDEYRLLVNPTVIGEGRPLFKNLKEKLSLKLANTRGFNSGNILLYYESVR